MRAYKVTGVYWTANDISKQFKSYIFVKKQKSSVEGSFFYTIREENDIFNSPIITNITTTEKDAKQVIYDYVMNEYESFFSQETNSKNRKQLMIEPITL